MFKDPSSWFSIMPSSDFMPHGHCYLWRTDLLLLHVASDLLIGLAYYSIPLAILYVVRNREDLPYPWLFGLFSAFILACGTTHLLAVWTAWNPSYWIQGGMKAITAAFSIGTAVALVPTLPKIMALRSPKDLERINISLRAEIEQRRILEQELKQATQVAKAASQAKTDFLARMSHELRTPLNGIVGMSQLLINTDLNSQQREQLGIIAGSGDTLLSLINDLLDISKVESGEFQLQESALSLSQIFDHVASELSLQAETADLALRTSIDPSIPAFLMGDKRRITQVLINLVQNAIKYTAQGQIELSASRTTPDEDVCHLRVEVSDTGIGIAEEYQDSLFDAFIQAERDGESIIEGTGLGLAICKQLVEKMGGEVGVASELGRGSTFWFTLDLPVAEAPAAGELPREPAATERRYAGLKALIVEDNPVNQTVAAATLETLGIKSQVVGNGAVAVSCLAEDSFDLVLMDCRMPVMDGYEATAAIRASDDQRVREVIIVALTANAISGDAERCLAAGMNDYLAKPIEFSALHAVLARWFGPDSPGA